MKDKKTRNKMEVMTENIVVWLLFIFSTIATINTIMKDGDWMPLFMINAFCFLLLGMTLKGNQK